MTLTESDFIKLTVSSSCWTPQSIRAAKTAYERYRERVILYGDGEVKK